MGSPAFRTNCAFAFARRVIGVCAVAGFALVLSGCGGGGGSDDSPPPTGAVAVTVKDQNGFLVPGATVVASVSSGTRQGTTDANGTLTLSGVSVGNGTLSVNRDTFKPYSGAVSVVRDQTTRVDVALERETKASGGVLSARVVESGLSADGKSLQFRVQVVVVDSASNSISGLQASAFTLASCTPDAATSAADCVTGGAADAGYVVTGPGPAPSFQEIPGGPAQPYAAALLFDQSESIRTNDPTDARLSAGREFLVGLGGNDRAALSALSAGQALIPEQPVTIYPVGNPSFSADGAFFFPMLDSLATQEGGGSPLYEALCRVMSFSAANAPAGLKRAIVLFSDGENSPQGTATTCNSLNQVLTRSTATAVSVYAVGLSTLKDGATLGTLADATNGAFLYAGDTAQLVTLYGSLGNLLSGTLTTYRLTYTITTDVAGAFAAGRSVRGTVAVNTGSGTVNVPIVVRIF